MCSYSFAPSGRFYCCTFVRRAMPWADVSLPLRGVGSLTFRRICYPPESKGWGGSGRSEVRRLGVKATPSLPKGGSHVLLSFCQILSAVVLVRCIKWKSEVLLRCFSCRATHYQLLLRSILCTAYRPLRGTALERPTHKLFNKQCAANNRQKLLHTDNYSTFQQRTN